MKIQTRNNIDIFIKELNKMSQAVYLACDTEVAADICLKTKKSVQLINNLLNDIDSLESRIRSILSIEEEDGRFDSDEALAEIFNKCREALD